MSCGIVTPRQERIERVLRSNTEDAEFFIVANVKGPLSKTRED
jgi:hypothetical protein